MPSSVLLLLGRRLGSWPTADRVRRADGRHSPCGSRSRRSGRSVLRGRLARPSACWSTRPSPSPSPSSFAAATGPAVAGGTFVGLTAIASYGLATRLFPDRFETATDMFNAYRLAEPLGYWNAFGLTAAMAIVLAVGFVAHARSGDGRLFSPAPCCPCSWSRSTLRSLVAPGLRSCAVWPGRSSSTRVALRCSGLSSSSPRPRRSASRSRRLERRSRPRARRRLGGRRGECRPSAGLAARGARPRFGCARLGCASRSAGRPRCEARSARRSRRPRRRSRSPRLRARCWWRGGRPLSSPRFATASRPLRDPGRLSTIGSSRSRATDGKRRSRLRGISV